MLDNIYDRRPDDGIGGAYRQGSNVPMPTQPPQVQFEANVLGENTEMLGKMVEQLEQQLGPVMRPVSNPELRNHRDNAIREGSPVAPHVQFLKERNEMLSRTITQLQDILQRLEI